MAGGTMPLQIAAAFSLFVRLRRAGGIERQQIKWFAYAAVATVVGGTLAYIVPDDVSLWLRPGTAFGNQRARR